MDQFSSTRSETRDKSGKMLPFSRRGRSLSGRHQNSVVREGATAPGLGTFSPQPGVTDRSDDIRIPHARCRIELGGSKKLAL